MQHPLSVQASFTCDSVLEQGSLTASIANCKIAYFVLSRISSTVLSR